MSLPPHVHQLLKRSHPAIIPLAQDDLAQLVAYLKHPESVRLILSRMLRENQRGDTSYRREITARQEFHKYLLRVRDYNLARSAVGDGARRPRPRRGVNSDVNGDEKIYDLWQTKRFKTYASLATELACRSIEVKRAIDRHRKRLAASE